MISFFKLFLWIAKKYNKSSLKTDYKKDFGSNKAISFFLHKKYKANNIYNLFYKYYILGSL